MFRRCYARNSSCTSKPKGLHRQSEPNKVLRLMEDLHGKGPIRNMTCNAIGPRRPASVKDGGRAAATASEANPLITVQRQTSVGASTSLSHVILPDRLRVSISQRSIMELRILLIVDSRRDMTKQGQVRLLMIVLSAIVLVPHPRLSELPHGLCNIREM